MAKSLFTKTLRIVVLLIEPTDLEESGEMPLSRDNRVSRSSALARIRSLRMAKPLSMKNQIKISNKLREVQERHKKTYKHMRQVQKQVKKQEQILRSRFLALPLEVRTKIYQELLVRDRVANMDLSEMRIFGPDGRDFQEPRFIAILRVSKQVYEEALPILYQQNTIKVSIHSKELVGIGTNGRDQLTRIEMYTSEPIGPDFDPDKIGAWYMIRDTCTSLRRLDLNTTGISGCYTVDFLENVYPFLGLSIASWDCFRLASPSIILTLTIDNRSDRYIDSDQNIAEGLKTGLELAKSFRFHSQHFALQRPFCSPGLEQIEVALKLSPDDLAKVRTDLWDLDICDYGFECPVPEGDLLELCDGDSVQFKWQRVDKFDQSPDHKIESAA